MSPISSQTNRKGNAYITEGAGTSIVPASARLHDRLIASSESNADNAITCLTAKHLRNDVKVITRMSRTENREKMQEVGSDAIISPAELAADAVMAKIEEFERKK